MLIDIREAFKTLVTPEVQERNEKAYVAQAHVQLCQSYEPEQTPWLSAKCSWKQSIFVIKLCQ